MILQLPNLAVKIRKFRIKAQYSYRYVLRQGCETSHLQEITFHSFPWSATSPPPHGNPKYPNKEGISKVAKVQPVQPILQDYVQGINKRGSQTPRLGIYHFLFCSIIHWLLDSRPESLGYVISKMATTSSQPEAHFIVIDALYVL